MRAPSLTRSGLGGEGGQFPHEDCELSFRLKVQLLGVLENLPESSQRHCWERFHTTDCLGDAEGGPWTGFLSMLTRVMLCTKKRGPVLWEAHRCLLGPVGNLTRASINALPHSPYRAWGHKKMILETSHPVILETNGRPDLNKRNSHHGR